MTRKDFELTARAIREEIQTRRGQLIEMAATLSRAKSDLEAVLQDFPEEAYGRVDLEEAIGLVGECEWAINRAADEMEKH